MNITARLNAIHDHLVTFDLPEPWRLAVTADCLSGREHVSVQLRSRSLPHVAVVLLAWADTLTELSAEAWRTPDGSSVHLAVCGQLADGTTVRVFDGVDHDSRFGLDLDERRSVSFACLREWASLDEGVAA
jgi:hypothetical protein